MSKLNLRQIATLKCQFDKSNRMALNNKYNLAQSLKFIAQILK